MTPDAKARLPINILLLVFFKKIKKHPKRVEIPAKKLIRKLYSTLFKVITSKLYEKIFLKIKKECVILHSYLIIIIFT